MDKLSLLVVLAVTVGLAAADTCSYYDSFGDTGYLYCSGTCCGDYYDRYCCYWTTGGITGLAIGITAFIAITVAIIIVCRRRRARLFYQQQVAAPGVTVVSSQVQPGTVAYPGVQPQQQQYRY